MSWTEAANAIYKHGHHADRLRALWLDMDRGLHKTVFQGIHFPKAKVERVDSFYDDLRIKGEDDLVSKSEILRRLKGIILRLPGRRRNNSRAAGGAKSEVFRI